MDVAPLATTSNAMLASVPFAIAEKRDAGAVHEQVERAVGTAIRDLDRQRLLSAAQRRGIGNGPVQAARRRRLATMPTAYLSGSLNSTLIDEQN